MVVAAAATVAAAARSYDWSALAAEGANLSANGMNGSEAVGTDATTLSGTSGSIELSDPSQE